MSTNQKCHLLVEIKTYRIVKDQLNFINSSLKKPITCITGQSWKQLQNIIWVVDTKYLFWKNKFRAKSNQNSGLFYDPVVCMLLSLGTGWAAKPLLLLSSDYWYT